MLAVVHGAYVGDALHAEGAVLPDVLKGDGFGLSGKRGGDSHEGQEGEFLYHTEALFISN